MIGSLFYGRNKYWPWRWVLWGAIHPREGGDRGKGNLRQILQRTENSFVYYVAHPWAGSSLTPSMRLVLSQWCGVKTTVTLIHPSSTVCQFSLPRRLETGKHYVNGGKTEKLTPVVSKSSPFAKRSLPCVPHCQKTRVSSS